MNTDNKTILRGFLSSIFCVVHRVCRAQERSACTMYRQAAVCAKRASRGARNQQGTEIRVRIWPTERNATYLVSMESGKFWDFYSTNSKFADDRWNWKERQYLQNNIRQTNNLDLTTTLYYHGVGNFSLFPVVLNLKLFLKGVMCASTKCYPTLPVNSVGFFTFGRFCHNAEFPLRHKSYYITTIWRQRQAFPERCMWYIQHVEWWRQDIPMSCRVRTPPGYVITWLLFPSIKIEYFCVLEVLCVKNWEFFKPEKNSVYSKHYLALFVWFSRVYVI